MSKISPEIQKLLSLVGKLASNPETLTFNELAVLRVDQNHPELAEFLEIIGGQEVLTQKIQAEADRRIADASADPQPEGTSTGDHKPWHQMSRAELEEAAFGTLPASKYPRQR